MISSLNGFPNSFSNGFSPTNRTSGFAGINNFSVSPGFTGIGGFGGGLGGFGRGGFNSFSNPYNSFGGGYGSGFGGIGGFGSYGGAGFGGIAALASSIGFLLGSIIQNIITNRHHGDDNEASCLCDKSKQDDSREFVNNDQARFLDTAAEQRWNDDGTHNMSFELDS